MRGWAATIVAALASVAGPVTLGQEAIRVEVNLVTVAFSVRDANGSLVDNLTKEDLGVDEDTVPQKIAYFARSVDVPLTLGLIVDASGSQEHFTKKHQHDLEVFLKDVLGPKDRVFLVGFGNHIRLVSDFSQSGAGLLEEWKQRADVLSLVTKLGLKLTCIGVGIGMVLAFGLTRVISSLLYGVKASDPVTYAVVAVGLGCVAMLACFIPARRAVKVDPMVALRYEKYRVIVYFSAGTLCRAG